MDQTGIVAAPRGARVSRRRLEPEVVDDLCKAQFHELGAHSRVSCLFPTVPNKHANWYTLLSSVRLSYTACGTIHYT